MENIIYKAGIYCRLSKDDPQEGESSSIVTQKSILLDYCAAQNYEVYKVYVDDGYSGLNFNRPGFLRTPLRGITSTGEIEQSFRLN